MIIKHLQIPTPVFENVFIINLYSASYIGKTNFSRSVVKQNINVVRLLTKSKENVEKSKQIYIKGLEEKKLD